jgi:hypothetical protein
MTPQHRLAIEIMSECGMMPDQIACADGWDVAPDLEKTEAIIEAKNIQPINLPKIPKGYYIEYKGVGHTASQWMQLNGLQKSVISYRRKAGWGLGAAYGKPLRKRKVQKSLFTQEVL